MEGIIDPPLISTVSGRCQINFKLRKHLKIIAKNLVVFIALLYSNVLLLDIKIKFHTLVLYQSMLITVYKNATRFYDLVWF